MKKKKSTAAATKDAAAKRAGGVPSRATAGVRSAVKKTAKKKDSRSQRVEYKAPTWKKKKKKTKAADNVGTEVLKRKGKIASLLKKFGLTK